MSTWHGIMANREEFMRWKISTNTVDGYKTGTKCAHSVQGRPTLKDEERFRNGLVRKPYERSLYEQTFMSEPFNEKHAISTEFFFFFLFLVFFLKILIYFLQRHIQTILRYMTI